MKALTKISTLILLLMVVTFGCKPDQSVEPKNDGAPELGFDGPSPHNRPTPQCMASVYSNLIDNLGSTQGGIPFPAAYGNLEVANDPTDLYVLVSMGGGWVIAEGRVFAGTCETITYNPDGTVNTEAFPISGPVNPAVQYWQANIKLDGITRDESGCACVVTWLMGAQTSLGGNLFNHTPLWGNGQKLGNSNGYYINACPVPCPFGNATAECYDVNPPARPCVDLTVEMTSGTPPYTMTWSNGVTTIVDANNMTGISTQNVCPTSAAVWTCLMTDYVSIYTDTVVFNVSPTPACCFVPRPGPNDLLGLWACGNGNGQQKVQVCHLPPGNPGNLQEICIATPALPAHIIDFKPQDKPCQGHHSGCHIGPCDPCGPGSTAAESITAAEAFVLQHGCSAASGGGKGK
jgi:hypothetical protein